MLVQHSPLEVVKLLAEVHIVSLRILEPECFLPDRLQLIFTVLLDFLDRRPVIYELSAIKDLHAYISDRVICDGFGLPRALFIKDLDLFYSI